MKRIFVTALTAFLGAAAAVGIMYAINPKTVQFSDSIAQNQESQFIQKVSITLYILPG